MYTICIQINYVGKTMFKHYITKEENIKNLYTSIENRVGKIGLYKNRKLLISWEDFHKFLSNDEQYNKIYKEWVEYDFYYMISPTIDRIDNNGDYTLENIQVLNKLQNTRKKQGSGIIQEKENIKLHLIDKRNEIILNLKYQGYSNTHIAELFNLNRSTVKRINDKFVQLDEDKRYSKLRD
jgi:hypothetical protein